MYQTWSWLGFLHWSYRPQVLQRLLPGGPRPHTFEGQAWVGATAAITLEVGDPLAPEQLGPFDHYLTARWQLYTTLGPLLARSTVDHEPWPLHRAVVRQLDGNLVVVAGLPPPNGEPVVHWSPGVRTRISGLRPLARA